MESYLKTVLRLEMSLKVIFYLMDKRHLGLVQQHSFYLLSSLSCLLLSHLSPPFLRAMCVIECILGAHLFLAYQFIYCFMKDGLYHSPLTMLLSLILI